MPVPRLRFTGAILLVVLTGTGCAFSGTEGQSLQGQWRVTEIGGSGVAGDALTTLDIGPGGMVSGSGGCNRYSGKAEIDGGTIAIGPVAATKMACAAVPMEQETQFFAALEQTQGWRIADGDLLLLDDRGTVLIRLAVADVLSGSGATYAGARFTWWTRGDEASLYDLSRGEDAPELTCRAV